MNLVEKTSADTVIKAGEPDKDDLFIPPIVLDADREDIVMKSEVIFQFVFFRFHFLGIF